MKATQRAHGTVARYRHGPDINDQPGKGCRCPDCGRAAALCTKRYALRVASGQGPRLVDAKDTRAHVQMLLSHGLAAVRVADLAGVPRGVVSHLLWGRPTLGQPPARRIRRDYAAALRQVSPGQLPAHGHVPAVGSARRLQALACAGWPSAAVAARVGVHQNHLLRVMSPAPGRQVGVALAAAVRDTYDALWNVSPESAGVRPQTVTRVRNQARARGYAPALAWDDDAIDDPTAKPRGVRAVAS